jgi:tRNA(His) 5'-end guanylyltransferase
VAKSSRQEMIMAEIEKVTEIFGFCSETKRLIAREDTVIFSRRESFISSVFFTLQLRHTNPHNFWI